MFALVKQSLRMRFVEQTVKLLDNVSAASKRVSPTPKDFFFVASIHQILKNISSFLREKVVGTEDN